MDTAAHARRMEMLFGLPEQSCGVVWVGAESDAFRPVVDSTHQSQSASIEVLFYGQFIPLHGVETIIAAARLMSEERVQWTLIGRGQEAVRIRRMLAEVPLPKLRWFEWVEYGTLQEWINRADVCLGIFGASDKAASVIPNKVFQALACARPIVTRDSPAIRELLTHNPPCVYLTLPADPDSLAAALREHQTRLAGQGRPVCGDQIASHITEQAIGRQFLAMIDRLDVRS
jgi:glycosyltransferase involved in cell wall biosynthesis